MSRIVVAGVVNVRTARRCTSFPVPFAPSVSDPGGISMRLSGTGWTTARTLQRLGGDVVFATYVGADDLGRFVIDGLRNRGLHGKTVLRCASQPRALVLYDGDGRRASTTDLRSTPDLRYPVSVFVREVNAGSPCAAAVLTNIGFSRSLIPAAIERGIPIATDIHLVDTVDSGYNRDWMRAAHILACSHERLPMSPQEWVRAIWRRFGTELVLVGCGADGAVLGNRSDRRVWHIGPSTPRGLRYTSGAGDTLLASFVHHQFALGNPVRAARYAVLTAGWKVGGSPDDEPGVPHRELADIVRLHGLPGVTRLD